MKWAGNTPLTNGTCRRSFTVDYFTACLPRTLLQFSLLRRRLSHCAVRVALIWFLARLALCFAFGVSFAVISPLSCSLSLSSSSFHCVFSRFELPASHCDWLLSLMEESVCRASPSLCHALSHSASRWLWATHIMVALCFRFPKGT